MDNTQGTDVSCAHTPLEQFDCPCPECPPWSKGQPFIFGGPGLMQLINSSHTDAVDMKL